MVAGRVATSPNAAETASIDLSDGSKSKNLLVDLDQLLTNAGFSDSRQKQIRSLFDPNFAYKNNPSFILEKEKWELNLAKSPEVRNNEVWKLWDEIQALKKKRQDHDRKLKGGNIEMKDGTYSWIDNQGESEIPGERKRVQCHTTSLKTREIWSRCVDEFHQRIAAAIPACAQPPKLRSSMSCIITPKMMEKKFRGMTS